MYAGGAHPEIVLLSLIAFVLLALPFWPSADEARAKPPSPNADRVHIVGGVEVHHIGGAVTPPQTLYAPEPTFTKEAKAAIKNSKQKTFDDTVKIYCLVGTDGTTSQVRVTKGIGLGLDEQAVRAVQKYRFKPATLEGQPVVVDVYIEVHFQVY